MVFDDTFLCVSAIACFVSGELCFKQCACFKCASVVTLSERALPNARCTFSQNLNDPIRTPYVGDLNLIIARVPFHIDTRSGQFFSHVLSPCRNTVTIYSTITHELLLGKNYHFSLDKTCDSSKDSAFF